MKYSDSELKELNNLLETKYNSGKRKEDIENWLTDSGALNKYGAVIYDRQPCLYETLNDKLTQATYLLSKKEYAIKKQLEHYDETNTF